MCGRGYGVLFNSYSVLCPALMEYAIIRKCLQYSSDSFVTFTYCALIKVLFVVNVYAVIFLVCYLNSYSPSIYCTLYVQCM